VELFDSLTVRENIELGRESILAGANPLTHLASSPGDRSLIRAATDEAIEVTGIGALLDRTVGDISTGQKRLVELARVLAGPFDMILLDEPSSGLDAAETLQFGRILIDVVTQRGVGILIVEHDMALVRQVCDQVWVLDFGRLIFQGSTSEMLASDVVKAAYLGSEGVEEVLAEASGQVDSAQQQATTGTSAQ
jgi:ABC-type branched-subunit amino acid transport system ATPase component